MRPWLLLPVAVLCALPPGASAQTVTGGAAPPSASGGAEFGAPARAKKRAARPRAKLRATHFAVEPSTLTPGASARISYRVDGASRRVRVRVELLHEGARSATETIRLGWKPTNVRRVNRWTVPFRGLPEGRYVARLHAVDDNGRTLVRTAATSGRSPVRVAGAAPVTVGTGIFPIRGDWSWGGEGSQFGAERGTHRHQGQDLTADEGTPVVSPRAGFVYWKAYQAGGAGHYVVVRGDDGRDYVFMHLVSGSIPVGREDAVTAGQVIGQVGDTGRSQGAHLHFEIWPCGWQSKGCDPIDPRPDLEAWAGR